MIIVCSSRWVLGNNCIQVTIWCGQNHVNEIGKTYYYEYYDLWSHTTDAFKSGWTIVEIILIYNLYTTWLWSKITHVICLLWFIVSINKYRIQDVTGRPENEITFVLINIFYIFI